MKPVLFFSLIFYFCNCSAQISHEELCKELYQFSKISGVFIKLTSVPKNYSEFFKIEELVTQDSTLSIKNGVYRFESITEDSGGGIFIKKNDSYEIFGMSNAESFFPRLMSFLYDPLLALTDSNKLLYINNIVNIYKRNLEFKTNVIIENKDKHFKYYIN